MKKSCAEGNEIFIFVEMKIVKRLAVDWDQPSSKQCMPDDTYGGIHVSQIEKILSNVPCILVVVCKKDQLRSLGLMWVRKQASEKKTEHE